MPVLDLPYAKTQDLSSDLELGPSCIEALDELSKVRSPISQLASNTCWIIFCLRSRRHQTGT